MSEKVIEVENGQIWTRKIGQGFPTLLISGGPGMYNYLEPVASILKNACEVILFDPKGCGRSSYDGSGYDIECCIEDMEAIRRAYGYNKWIVIGHSWGADLGLAYSIQYPQSIMSFVSISGTGIQNDRDWKNTYKQNKEEIGEKMPDFEYEVNKTVHRALINSWRTFIKQPELLKQLSNINMPILFIAAENDIRPSWPIQQISALIEHSEFIEIQGAEHYIWLNKKEELEIILGNFISLKL